MDARAGGLNIATEQAAYSARGHSMVDQLRNIKDVVPKDKARWEYRDQYGPIEQPGHIIQHRLKRSEET